MKRSTTWSGQPQVVPSSRRRGQRAGRHAEDRSRDRALAECLANRAQLLSGGGEFRVGLPGEERRRDRAPVLRPRAAIRPEGSEALVDIGYILDLQGDWKGAVAYYNRAIVADPLRPEAYIDLGYDYNEHRLFALAEAAFLKGLSVSSGRRPPTLHARGDVQPTRQDPAGPRPVPPGDRIRGNRRRTRRPQRNGPAAARVGGPAPTIPGCRRAWLARTVSGRDAPSSYHHGTNTSVERAPRAKRVPRGAREDGSGRGPQGEGPGHRGAAARNRRRFRAGDPGHGTGSLILS